MSERFCAYCRWYDGDDVSGLCRKNAPQPGINDGIEEYQYFADWPTTMPENFCGQWADKTITPEQEERRELVRRFAVAIVSGDDEATGARYKPSTVWMMAEQLADAEPKSEGAR